MITFGMLCEELEKAQALIALTREEAAKLDACAKVLRKAEIRQGRRIEALKSLIEAAQDAES